jgi:hypothetical protein
VAARDATIRQIVSGGNPLVGIGGSPTTHPLEILGAGAGGVPAIRLGALGTGAHIWDIYSTGPLQTTVGGAGGFAVYDVTRAIAAFWVDSSGRFILPSTWLTAGTLTEVTKGLVGKAAHTYAWTNAMVTALGAVTDGNFTAFTLPAKTVVVNAYIVVDGNATGVTTLNVCLGRAGGGLFDDYLLQANVRVAAGTMYGGNAGERGTNMSGYDLPSMTGTTAVKLRFVSTGGQLNAVANSAGRVIIITQTLP